MASLRNAVKRVTHKERAQPRSRKRFGLLEKHSDYVERAQDHHKKRDYLTRLRRKAALRNPDEFHHGMLRTSTKKGVHEVDPDATIDTETVKLLKTQDAAYLQTMKKADEEKARRLRDSLHGIGRKKTRKAKATHTVFVEDAAALRSFDAAEHFDTVPELLGRRHNRVRRAQLEEQEVAGGDADPAAVEGAQKERAKAYQELEARERRAEKIGRTLAHVETQKKVMGKGRKRKIKGAEDGAPAQYKWKRVRSR